MLWTINPSIMESMSSLFSLLATCRDAGSEHYPLTWESAWSILLIKIILPMLDPFISFMAIRFMGQPSGAPALHGANKTQLYSATLALPLRNGSLESAVCVFA